MAEKPDVYLVGKDGLPLDLPSDAEQTRADAVLFEREMKAARDGWESGDLTAFLEAMRLCWREGRIPDWLFDASTTVVERAMAEEEKLARRHFRIHLARWEAVTELRQRRDELHRIGDDRGMSLERARAAVSELFENDEAAGSADAVKASYELIEAAGGANATFESYLEVRRQREARRQRKPG